MKSIPIAIALATMSAAAAAAPNTSFVSAPLPVDKTSELVVAVVNTCATAAVFKVSIKDGASGAVLASKQGTVAAKRGVVLTYHSGSIDRDLVVAGVGIACQTAARPVPLISFTVRDWQTKVPRFAGDSQEGTGI